MIVKRDNQRMYKEQNGVQVAYIQYRHCSDYIEANRVFVEPSYRGQGLAEQLVDALVSRARDEHLLIKPTCSYVVQLFERKPIKYNDVMYR